MRTFRVLAGGISCLFVVVFASLPARAQSAPKADRDPGVRVRVGVGGEGGAVGSGKSGGGGALGFYLRFGVQASDLVGVHLSGAVSSFLLTDYARGALIVDFSPLDFVSLGTGVTMVGTRASGLLSSSTKVNTIYGAPIVLGFYVGGRDPSGKRHGVGFLLNGTFGADSNGNGAYGGMLAIGYEQR